MLDLKEPIFLFVRVIVRIIKKIRNKTTFIFEEQFDLRLEPGFANPLLKILLIRF